MIFNTLKTVLNSSDSFSTKLQPLIIFLRLEKSSSFGSNEVLLCEAKLNRNSNSYLIMPLDLEEIRILIL